MRKPPKNEFDLGLAPIEGEQPVEERSEGFRPTADRWQIRHIQNLQRVADDDKKAELIAEWIVREFDSYYIEFRQISFIAEDAFVERNFSYSLQLSRTRLSVYSESIRELANSLLNSVPALQQREDLWKVVEDHYRTLTRGRYEADLAFAYINSVHRVIYRGEWIPVEYEYENTDAQGEVLHSRADVNVYWTFPVSGTVSATDISAVIEALSHPESFKDVDSDCVVVADMVQKRLSNNGMSALSVRALEMIAAGFYRNRGAYLVGRMVFEDDTTMPLILALENNADGIFVDAVLTSEHHCHNIFSSTLANFHVTHMHYHELATFLYELMPKRPLGLHYSTIGFNHIGKVAVINDLRRDVLNNARRFVNAIGSKGTVAIGFAGPESGYNLKVIRDHPTKEYKWGNFEGIDSVLSKYRRVHEINRTGSMLDNIIYTNLKLDREYFNTDLLEELLSEASESVSLMGDDVVFKHLIVQLRVTPLPVFLETANDEDAHTAITNLGYCIKNNSAANIFNKDLDARNYGVSPYLKVYLFDYDALEPFVDVKIRTNIGQEDGEEDIPDWYFEEGVVFLPEEMESGLMLKERTHRRIFIDQHGDLMTTEYWESVQNNLREGRVPPITIYPVTEKIRSAPLGIVGKTSRF